MGRFVSGIEGLFALTAAALAFATVLFAPAILAGGDAYWHIAAGRWMLENRAILRIDPFSFTFAGHPWRTQEWLAEAAMALAFIGAGWKGLALLFATAAGLTAGLLVRHLSRQISGIGLIAGAVVALACAAAGLAAEPLLLALPLLEMWTAELVFARRQGRRPAWIVLALMPVWANLHASFFVGIALAIGFAVRAAAEKSARETHLARDWVLFAAASVVLATITPYGAYGLAYSLNAVSLLGIGQWIAIVGIAGSLIAAGPLAGVLGGAPVARERTATLAPAALFAAVIALILGIRLLEPIDRADGADRPQSALAHVPQSLTHMPVLNDCAFGGYLIFHDVRPFIDSRAGLYSPAFVRRYERIAGGDAPLLANSLTKYHIRWTMLAPGTAAVRAMDGLAGWHRIYADRWAVVHARNESK